MSLSLTRTSSVAWLSQKEPSITQPKEATPESAKPTQADSPAKEAIMKVTEGTN